MRKEISRGMDAALRALVIARQLESRWKEVVDVYTSNFSAGIHNCYLLTDRVTNTHACDA